MRTATNVALIALVLALFAVMDGFCNWTFAGYGEKSNEWFQLGTLALLIGAFCAALWIMDRRRPRR